jgi:hypothetical protein
MRTLGVLFILCPTMFAQSVGLDAAKPRVVVFSGDTVIPQIVDGGSWKTTFKFVNLDNYPVSFNLLFFDDSGLDLYLPILSSPTLAGGTFRGISISLNVAGSITIETAATAAVTSQGWAIVSRNASDSIGGFAIFRQRLVGLPDQEATVPIVNQFSNHFVMLFDNTAFVTGIAIANPTSNSVSIPVAIRNEEGQVIDSQFIALGPFQHTAFVLSALWPSTAGKAGAMEFLTSGFGVAALGLRFNGPAFTSFDVLQNIAWTQP